MAFLPEGLRLRQQERKLDGWWVDGKILASQAPMGRGTGWVHGAVFFGFGTYVPGGGAAQRAPTKR